MPKSPLDIASLIQARNGTRGHSLPSGSSSSILCSLTRILLTVEARTYDIRGGQQIMAFTHRESTELCSVRRFLLPDY